MKFEKTFIGIDYSLKSPAVTFADDGKLTYFIFPRKGTLKEKYIETLRASNVIVTEIDDIKNVKDLALNERLNSTDSENLARNLADTIWPYMGTKETRIAIEGISFASPGNTKVQYAGYHYVLRLLLTIVLPIKYDDIYVYAPNTVKKTAGKGNFKKDQMIEAFINSDAVELQNCPLRNGLIKTPELYQSPKAKHYMKPLDDIVDSYWTMKTLLNELENN